MGTGNSALFEVSSNSTCCKFFSAPYLCSKSSSLNGLFRGGGVSRRATVPWEVCKKHLWGSVNAVLFVGRALLSKVLSHVGASLRACGLSEWTQAVAPGFSKTVGEVPILMVGDINFPFVISSCLVRSALSWALFQSPGGDVTSPRYKTHRHKKKMLEKLQWHGCVGSLWFSEMKCA